MKTYRRRRLHTWACLPAPGRVACSGGRRPAAQAQERRRARTQQVPDAASAITSKPSRHATVHHLDADGAAGLLLARNAGGLPPRSRTEITIPTDGVLRDFRRRAGIPECLQLTPAIAAYHHVLHLVRSPSARWCRTFPRRCGGKYTAAPGRFDFDRHEVNMVNRRPPPFNQRTFGLTRC